MFHQPFMCMNRFSVAKLLCHLLFVYLFVRNRKVIFSAIFQDRRLTFLASNIWFICSISLSVILQNIELSFKGFVFLFIPSLFSLLIFKFCNGASLFCAWFQTTLLLFVKGLILHIKSAHLFFAILGIFIIFRPFNSGSFDVQTDTVLAAVWQLSAFTDTLTKR